jgi:hypothetical protein
VPARRECRRGGLRPRKDRSGLGDRGRRNAACRGHRQSIAGRSRAAHTGQVTGRSLSRESRFAFRRCGVLDRVALVRWFSGRFDVVEPGSVGVDLFESPVGEVELKPPFAVVAQVSLRNWGTDRTGLHWEVAHDCLSRDESFATFFPRAARED